jgi:hypothetical protein
MTTNRVARITDRIAKKCLVNYEDDEEPTGCKRSCRAGRIRDSAAWEETTNKGEGREHSAKSINGDCRTGDL